MSTSFVAYDASFARVTGPRARLDKVVDCDAHEGPVYADGDVLYATSLPTNAEPARIIRVDLDGDRFPVDPQRVTTVQTATTMPNGMTLAPDRRLIVCEQGDMAHDACISIVDPATGERLVLVDGWRGRRLNSPNDAVVGRDGAIWFTDPGYGYLQGFRPEREVGDYVYRWDPTTNRVDVVADGFDKPNGIALSADGGTLYVTDSGANQAAGTFYVDRPAHVVAFDVTGGRHLGPRRLLAVTSPGFPDGIAVDVDGRVYVSATSGVIVLSPEGDLLGEIIVPGAVNFTFGGPERNVLFVTADTAVWAATLAVTGPAPVATASGPGPNPTIETAAASPDAAPFPTGAPR